MRSENMVIMAVIFSVMIGTIFLFAQERLVTENKALSPSDFALATLSLYFLGCWVCFMTGMCLEAWKGEKK